MRHLIYALLVWLLCSSLPAGAQVPGLQPPARQVRVGDFVMMKPAGWRRVVQNGLVMLSAPTVTPGAYAIISTTSSALEPDLRTSFQNQWQFLQRTYRVVDGGQIQQGQLAQGFPYVSTNATVVDLAGKRSALLFMVLQNQSLAEGFLAITDDFQPAAYSAFQQDLKGVIASIHFASGPEPGAQPAPPATGMPGAESPATQTGGGGPLAGIYRAIADNTDPLDLSDPANKTPNYRYLTFFPDGKVKEGLPLTGLQGYIEESDANHGFNGSPSSAGHLIYVWGFYVLAGDNGKIEYIKNAYGGRQVDRAWPLQRSSDGLEIQGNHYLQLDPCNSLKVEGTFKPFGDPKQKGITFSRSGDFVDEGILNYGRIVTGYYGRASGTGVGIGFEAPNGGRGMYQIRNYTLTLQYGSSSPSALFFIEPGTNKDDLRVVYINNIKYQRVQ